MKIKRSKAELAGLVVLIVLSALLLPILVVNVILIVKGSVNPSVPPDVFGIAPLAVVSPSMTGEEEDSFGEGALIFVKILSEEEKESLEAGDVITFRDGETYVTHRILSVSLDEAGTVAGYVTKGDFNDFVDPGLLLPESVVGECVGHVEGLGGFAMFLQTPAGVLVFVGIPVVAFIAFDLIRTYFYNRKVRAEERAAAAEEGETMQRELREKEEELARLRALVGERETPPSSESAEGDKGQGTHGDNGDQTDGA